MCQIKMDAKNLKIKEIPLPSGADHPEPPNQVLPKHEFSMGFIGMFIDGLFCDFGFLYQ